MTKIIGSLLKKGYIPLAGDNYCAIGWQGSFLKDFWMWNRKFIEYKDEIKHIRSVRVKELKEAALHYWRDKWVPLKPIDEDFIRRMEGALREHKGLKREGIKVPDDVFLEMPEPIPEEHLGPEVRSYLGMDMKRSEKLTPKESVPKEILESYRVADGKGVL